MQENMNGDEDPAELNPEFPEDQASVQEVYEQSLHENERRLREAERLAKLGHWEFDIKANRLHWSDETYRIFDLDPDEFEPSYETFLELIHPSDRVHVKEQYEASVADHSQYNVYHRLVLKSGIVRFVNERCKTIYNEQDDPVRSFGTILDMTDHEREIENLMRAKSGLEIYAEGLESEIEQISDQLEREKEELSKARELIKALKENL
jgi:PAS domain S-box-containing protein